MSTDQPTDNSNDLTVTLDSGAVELILEGLAYLPYGKVQPLYDALKSAAEDLWGIEEDDGEPV